MAAAICRKSLGCGDTLGRLFRLHDFFHLGLLQGIAAQYARSVVCPHYGSGQHRYVLLQLFRLKPDQPVSDVVTRRA